MDSQTDRLAMLQALGDLWHHGGIDFYGVFEMPYELMLGMDGYRPTLTVEAAKSDEIALSDTITRQNDNAIYTVRAREPDGTGMVRLVLEQQ